MGGDAWFFLVFLGVCGFLVLQVARHGSLSGAMFGARTEGEIGRVDGRAKGRRRVTVAVMALATPSDAKALGVYFTGRAAVSVSRLGASLSRDDARAVADALDAAASEAEGSRAREDCRA